MDSLFLSKDKFDDLANKHEGMIEDLKEKVRVCMGDYDSEDDS